VDDSVSVNDIDLSLYIPRDVDETGITVASLERFSTYTSDKDEGRHGHGKGFLGYGKPKCICSSEEEDLKTN
ncbi:zinc finger CCCH-type containing 15, partial [Homo sapiens]